jgi:integrase
VRGIILAGGTGVLAAPDHAGDKQAVSAAYDKPTVYDPLSIVMLAGIRDLLVDHLYHPRFLDDAAATKLLQAARADDDPFVRLTVEFLAWTGMRKGEYLALTTDAVMQIGSAY